MLTELEDSEKELMSVLLHVEPRRLTVMTSVFHIINQDVLIHLRRGIKYPLSLYLYRAVSPRGAY